MTARFHSILILVAKCLPLALALAVFGCSPPAPDTTNPSPIAAPNPPLPSDPYQAGKVEALRDLKNGLFVEITYGKVPAWIPQYQAIMKTNYNVDVVVEDVENLSAEMIDRIRGYNEVSVPEIERLHGEGVIKRAAQKAEQMFAAAPLKNPASGGESTRAETTPPSTP